MLAIEPYIFKSRLHFRIYTPFSKHLMFSRLHLFFLKKRSDRGKGFLLLNNISMFLDYWTPTCVSLIMNSVSSSLLTEAPSLDLQQISFLHSVCIFSVPTLAYLKSPSQM